jgi:hypothetical protein
MRAAAAIPPTPPDGPPPPEYSVDLPLEDSQLGRIDEIVGRVDRSQRRANLLEARPGVVIVRSLDLIQDIIGIGCLECRRHGFIKP